MYRRHTTIDTALGRLSVVAADDTLTGVYFPGHRPPPAVAFGPEVAGGSDSLLAEAGAQLDAYLQATRVGFDLPIRTHGSPFEERIWGLLRGIPYGETTTYGTLATRLGDGSLARAVGRTVGRNPLSVVIPCHRVVGSQGQLTGYAGGLDRKRRLLQLESRAAAVTLF